MVYPVASSTPDSGKAITAFRFNRPIVEGATLVSGTGPAGVPVLLQDVTFMGTTLANAVIGQDGTFAFKVAPLEKNHRIGICLGDLTATSFKPEDFDAQAYQGPEAMQVPQVRFYYDTVKVQAKP